MPPSAFLKGIGFLQTFRYSCFVLCYSVLMAMATAMVAVAGYQVVFGSGPLEERRVWATLGLSVFCGVLGAGSRVLARGEQQNIFEQQERDLANLRFQSEEDQRRRHDEHIGRAIEAVKALPPKSQEKILADVLGRLQPAAPKPAPQRRSASG